MKYLEYPAKHAFVAIGLSAFALIVSADKAHAGDSSGLAGVIGKTLNSVTDTTKSITQPVINDLNSTVKNLPSTISSLPITGALVAPSSLNGNTVSATTQTVNTSFGKITSVDLVGDGLTQIAVGKDSTKLLAEKHQTKNGSMHEVSLTTRQTQQLLDNVVNMGGMNQADSVNMRNGVIVLGGTPKNVHAATAKPNAKKPNDVQVASDPDTSSFVQQIEDGVSSFFSDDQTANRPYRYDDAEQKAILNK